MIIARLDPDFLKYSIGAVAMIIVLYFALRLRKKIRVDMEKEKEQIAEWEKRQAEEHAGEELTGPEQLARLVGSAGTEDLSEPEGFIDPEEFAESEESAGEDEDPPIDGPPDK